MKLTADQIRPFAENVGFTGADLDTAVAIALAESGGDTEAYDAEPEFFSREGIAPAQADGKGSYGLWQIFLWEHPEFEGWNLDDPQVNACAMRATYMGAHKTFRPWSTWLSGDYKKWLTTAILGKGPGAP